MSRAVMQQALTALQRIIWINNNTVSEAVEALKAELEKPDQSDSHELLLASHEPDRSGPSFLEWVADRLVLIHGENENADFIGTLRRRAQKAREAIAKAVSE